MPPMTVKELREKRANLAELANAILKKAHDDKREVLTSEEEQEWQRIHDEIDALKRHIDMQEKQEAVTKQLGEPVERKVEPIRPAAEGPRHTYADSMRDVALAQHKRERT